VKLALSFVSALLFMAPAYAADESAYDDLISAASAQYHVDFELIKAVIKQESAFNPNAGSSAGAVGLMQLTPIALEEINLSGIDRTDPAQNIDAGTKYLAQMLAAHNGNVVLALASYNAGPGAVANYGGVPPYNETIDYVHNIAGFYAAYGGPILDTSSVPPAGSGSSGGRSPGTSPLSLTPTVYADSAEILKKFEAYSGVSTTTMSGFFRGILVALSMFFAGLQILFFWSDAVTKGKNGFDALFKALVYSLRTLGVVVVLFSFISTT